MQLFMLLPFVPFRFKIEYRLSIIMMDLDFSQVYWLPPVMPISQIGFRQLCHKDLLSDSFYSWEVKDGAFVTVSELSNSSVLASQIMASWLEQLSVQQREALTKQLFAIPDRAGMADALTVQTVQKALPNIFLQWKSLPQEERELLQGAWTHLFDVAKQELKKVCSSHFPFFQEE